MIKGLTRIARKFSEENLKKTALYDFHVKNGGKMVPFCGWAMPVLYGKVGINESHMHCRTEAAMFDVGHMGQIIIRGEDRFEFIESMVPGNIKDLKVGNARLTQIVNEDGGIMDDTIYTQKDGYVYQVVNAGCAEADWAHFNKQLEKFEGDCQIEFIEDRALIALQGPKAADVVQRFVEYDLSEQLFMSARHGRIGEIDDCWIARLGYTGEDGFEISVHNDNAEELAELFLEQPEVELAGLGPRDTLRLESGLCLMGSDMNPETTPIEAGLRWTVGKRRRQEANFPGAEKILDQWKNGTDKMLIGFEMDSKRVPREHCMIEDVEGNIIGEVTSGTMSPCLKVGIGMGYVPIELAAEDSKLVIDIRGKKEPAHVVSMPFVKQNYYRGKK